MADDEKRFWQLYEKGERLIRGEAAFCTVHLQELPRGTSIRYELRDAAKEIVFIIVITHTRDGDRIVWLHDIGPRIEDAHLTEPITPRHDGPFREIAQELRIRGSRFVDFRAGLTTFHGKERGRN